MNLMGGFAFGSNYRHKQWRIWGRGWVEHSSFWPEQISHGIEIGKVKHGMPLSVSSVG